MARFAVVTVVIVVVLATCDAAKILTLSPFFGKSHAIFIHAITTELANRGHELTVITSNPIKDPPKNYHQIVVVEGNPLDIKEEEMFTFFRRIPMAFSVLFLSWATYESSRKTLENKEVKALIENKDKQFDLVLSEMFFQESLYMFSHKYKAPLVLLASGTYFSWIDQVMGNPSTTSYLGHELSGVTGDMTFLERIYNYIFSAYYNFVHKYLLFCFHNRLAQKHFASLGQDLPRLEDIDKNVSVVLINTHYSFDDVRPMVPGVVEIGGVHLEKQSKQQIPEDLQKFLDEAKQGVVYMSLGSQLKSSKMSKENKEAFFSVFGKLKERVVWKWEDDNPPAHLKNVYTGKWLPQGAILAHPNVKVFISHCGMLGSQEAVNLGVPVIGIPIYGDQPKNAAKLQQRGMALTLEYSKLSEESISRTLKEMLSNTSYYNAAKEVSRRYHDKPKTALESAMFWIEYVIRHQGAGFMKSKSVHMSCFRYFSLDIILTISLGLFSLLCVLKKDFWNDFYKQILLPVLMNVYFIVTHKFRLFLVLFLICAGLYLAVEKII